MLSQSCLISVPKAACWVGIGGGVDEEDVVDSDGDFSLFKILAA